MNDIVLREFPTMAEISALIDRSQAVGLGSRAKKAAELAVGGMVRKLPSAGEGRDRWEVRGDTGTYMVSVSESLCGCVFNAYHGSQSGYGRLCSHQLACIFLSLWWGLGNRVTPDKHFEQMFGHAIEDNSGILDLRVTVRFNNHAFDTTGRRMASANQEVVTGYRTVSREWIDLPHPIVIGGHTGDVIHPDLFTGFWQVVDFFNWRICGRRRIGTFEFIYRFVPFESENSIVGVDDPWLIQTEEVPF